MLQHTPLCTRARRNFCARVPAAPDRAADREAVRNAQCKMKMHKTEKTDGDCSFFFFPLYWAPLWMKRKRNTLRMMILQNSR